jgi:hypothetical protein
MMWHEQGKDQMPQCFMAEPEPVWAYFLRIG